MMKVAILGGGLAGLLLAHKMLDRGVTFHLFEKRSVFGGLIRKIRKGRYYINLGPHAIYSKNVMTMDFYNSLPLNYRKMKRNVKICYRDADNKIYSLEYPFENGIGDLPLSAKVDCILGYAEALYSKKRSKFDNLFDWIENGLGFGIAKHFMVPYNTKIWNCPLDEISTGLIKNKIEPTPMRTVIENIFGAHHIGRAYQAEFIYPKPSIDKVAEYLLNDIKEYSSSDSEVTSLTKINKKWFISINNQTLEGPYDKVVSTIPLTNLLQMINIDNIEKVYPQLRYNSTYFVMVGLKEGGVLRNFKDCQWVFFPNEEIFYRISILNNFNNELPVTVIAEITNKDNMLNLIKNDMLNWTIKDLVRLNIVASEADIEETEVVYEDFTYPIPTVGLDELKQELREKFHKSNIYLLGRAGFWDYLNMDGIYEKVVRFISEHKNDFLST